ncbi:MAG TPA: hypothetical protein VH062_19310 [Polyangiaceae bacterium]|jgi:hypothetical protein|nr:hypothetical protein [Polyangiaceae bacterium]
MGGSYRVLDSFSRRAWLVTGASVVMLSVVIAALIGPGQTALWDSATYLDGARHLAAGAGYTTSRGALGTPDGTVPITLWPPGFSVMIALGLLCHLESTTAAALALGASYVVTVVGFFACASVVTGRRALPLVLLATLFVALMPAMLTATDAVLSDLPFTAVVSVATFLLVRLASLPRPSLRDELACGVALSSCFWFRYAGIGIVVGGLAGLFLCATNASLRERAARVKVPFFVVLAATSLLVVRNWHFKAGTFGTRPFHVTGFWRHLELAIDGIIGCALVAARFRVALEAVLATWIVIGVFMGARGAAKSSAVRLLAAVLVSYFATMLASATLTDFNLLDEERFWLPVCSLLLLLLVAVAFATELRLARAYTAVIAVPMAVATMGFVVRFVVSLPRAHRLNGLSAREWYRAATEVPDNAVCELVTNDARPFLVHRSIAPSASLPTDVTSFRKLAHEHRKLCIAFVKRDLPRSTAGYANDQLLVIGELERHHRLKRLASDAYVEVYLVK